MRQKDMDRDSIASLPPELLEIVLERSADEVFLMREDGSLVYANPSACERRGVRREEMLQCYVWDWNRFVTRESWKRRWESLRTIKTVRFESEHMRLDGVCEPVDVMVYLIIYNDTQLCLCFVNNLTELKSKVAELEANQRELSEAKARAESAVRQLEEIQRRRELILGTVAHELRTPISAISMMADEKGADWNQYKSDINRIAKHLTQTLDDMKRITTGEQQRAVTLEEFTLRELIDSVNVGVSAYTSLKSIKYTLRCEVDDILLHTRFYSDAYRLRVVIGNLIKNACLHSEGDQVQLVIALDQVTDNEYRLSVQVIDNGKGIPSADLERLFQPYERGMTSASGTGLGLNIAKTWLADIDGSIQLIDSSQGATFEVVVAIHRAKKSESEASAPQLDKKTILERSKGLRVLFVEDDRILRMLGAKILEPVFAQLDVVEDGSQALLKAQETEQIYDVVITDYFMPEMNGVELIKNLKEINYPAIILGLTAASMGNEADHMVEAGADRVFIKPLNRDLLLDELVGLLDRGPASQGVEAEVEVEKSSVVAAAEEPESLFQDSGRFNPVETQTHLNSRVELMSDTAQVIINTKSGLITANDRWLEINAIPPGKAITKSLLAEVVAEESRQAYIDFSRTFFAQPIDAPPASVELQLQTFDLRPFAGCVTASKFNNDAGDLCILASLEVLQTGIQGELAQPHVQRRA